MFCYLVYGFVCFRFLESEGIFERMRDCPPDGPDPSRDRDEGCTENDDEDRWKDASPQLSDKWVPEVKEVGAHCCAPESRKDLE